MFYGEKSMTNKKGFDGIDDTRWFEFTEKLPFLSDEEVEKELQDQMDEVLKKFE